jgi:hypothetical protein
MGTWPGLGGEGLTAGKDAVKAIIEKHGGKVTSGSSKITNFLVIGTAPGKSSMQTKEASKLWNSTRSIPLLSTKIWLFRTLLGHTQTSLLPFSARITSK